MVVYDDPDAMIAWAQERTPTGAPYREDARAIGLASDSDHSFVAVVVFDTFTPWDCQVHVVASRRWIDPIFMRHACAFAFLTCGYERVGAIISQDNRPALSLARWMGFRREGYQRMAGIHNEGMVALGLLRAQCRWLPKTMAPPRQAVRSAL